MKGTKELVRTDRPRMLTPFEEMERWLENIWSRPYSLLRAPLWGKEAGEIAEISPTVDIYEEGNHLVVKTDLPGVKKEDIEVHIADNLMTISGEKRREEQVKSEGYYRFERAHGSFSRSFELPVDLDTEKAKAHFENGVLEVRIPKSEEAAKKMKKVSIE